MTKHLISPDHIFDELLNEAKRHKAEMGSVLTVFDLDSTLVEVGPRMTQIMRDFSRVKQNLAKFPKECKVLENYIHNPSDWGIESSLERIGLASSSFEFFKAVMKFWKPRFFSNDYLKHDKPIPGAKEFLKELESIGVNIAYLTARESNAMLKGTIDWLIENNFPLHSENENLFLKESNEKKDPEFKRDVIKDLMETHTSIWFFENEPINLRIVKETLPNVKLVYIDTVHSGREPAPRDLAIINNFIRGQPK